MQIMMAFVIIVRMAPAPMTVPAMDMDVMAAVEGMGGIAGRRAGYRGGRPGTERCQGSRL